MSVKEQVVQALETLSESELAEVSTYLALLKARERTRGLPSVDQHQAALYAEFAAEDRRLAEHDIADCAEGLRAEDSTA